MGSGAPAAVVVCAAALAALLWAEWRGSRAGIWLAKTTASTAFVAAALLWGALGSSYGALVLLALCLSWLGDVLLIPKGRPYFLLGLVCFLLAHLAFSAAFALSARSFAALLVGGLAMAACGLVIARWLWPHLDRRLRPAVAGYVAAISLMVTTASGTVVALGPAILAGALAFAISDVFVARHRFVVRSLTNKFIGLPLYYLGQLVLASTVR